MLTKIRNVTNYLMLGIGAGCLVIAYSIASAFVVPIVITGGALIFLALIKISPELCRKCLDSDDVDELSKDTSQALFYVFTVLSAGNLAFSLW